MSSRFAVTDLHLHLAPASMLHAAARRIMERDPEHAAQVAAFLESPSAFLAFLDRCGIERGALISYVAPDVMGYPAEINDWTASYCAAAPDRLIAFGSVHPRFERDPAAETHRVLDLGIAALKVHPPHQLFDVNEYRTGGPGRGIGEVFRVAQERRVPVMIHTGTSTFPGARNVYADPMPVDDVAVDFPELQIVLAHAGRPLHGASAFFLARRHRNVWLDLSGIPPRRLLDALPRLEEVADRCLWGTDWPGPGVPDPAANVSEFLALDLSDAVKRAILHENSLRLV